jgi:hypothetical protein
MLELISVNFAERLEEVSNNIYLPLDSAALCPHPGESLAALPSAVLGSKDVLLRPSVPVLWYGMIARECQLSEKTVERHVFGSHAYVAKVKASSRRVKEADV